MEETRKDKIISNFVNNQLKSKESQDKYLSILNLRIEENRKSMNRYSVIMLLIVFAFPLIIETKISEVSLGPFKLSDNSLLILILPSVFAFVYYKYITIWIDLADQKHIYSVLTSKLYNLKFNSFLNNRLRYHSIIESFSTNHLGDEPGNFGCIVNIVWIPVAYGLIASPFIFEFYSIIKIYRNFELNSITEWILFLTPIIIILFTILILVKTNRDDINRRNPVNKK